MNNKEYTLEDFRRDCKKDFDSFKKLRDEKEQNRRAHNYMAFNYILRDISEPTDEEIVALTYITKKIYLTSASERIRSFEDVVDDVAVDYNRLKSNGQITEDDICGKDLSLKELEKLGLYYGI